MQDSGPADRKADNGSQRGYQHEIGAEVKDVGQNGGDGEDDSQYVEPQWGVDLGGSLRAQVLAKTQLQQESCESDGRHDDQGQRTVERGAASVDHHQSEREQEQSGGDDSPAARLRLWRGRGGRVGSGVGQGVPSQVIQGGVWRFKWAGSGLLTLRGNVLALLKQMEFLAERTVGLGGNIVRREFDPAVVHSSHKKLRF
jgi:hypothetical protein